MFNERRRGSKQQQQPPPPWRLPAVSFLVAPDNPSKRRLATTGGAEETNTFLMKDCDVCRCQPAQPPPSHPHFLNKAAVIQTGGNENDFFVPCILTEQRVAQRAES